MEEIRQDIKDQIAKTELAFTNKDLLSEDIDTLSKVLKKTTRDFNIYKVMSIVISSALAVVSLLKCLDSIDSVNLNRAGILIIISISSLTQTFIYYKIKVNLENKIYLLGLLNKINRK
jgi:hypothetical protein